MSGAARAGAGEAAGAARLGARARWLIAAAVLFALTLVLRAGLEWVGSFPGDRWASHHLDTAHAPGWASDLGFFFAAIGTPAVSALTVLAGCWFVLRSAGRRAVHFALLAFLGVGVNALLKWLSGPTPIFVAENGAVGYNYPSGHTVYATVFFGALAWIAWRGLRTDIALVLLALVAAMGPMRVVIETHYVSDVIAGYLVGGAWLILSAVLTGWVGTREAAKLVET